MLKIQKLKTCHRDDLKTGDYFQYTDTLFLKTNKGYLNLEKAFFDSVPSKMVMPVLIVIKDSSYRGRCFVRSADLFELNGSHFLQTKLGSVNLKSGAVVDLKDAVVTTVDLTLGLGELK